MNAAAVALRTIREQAGLSVADAARAAGVAPSWLARVEADRAALTPAMASKISRALTRP